MAEISSEEDFYNHFFEAERKRAAGQLNEAADYYLKLLSYRLKQGECSASDFSNYDAIVIERLADLAQLFGIPEASINLLTGLQQLYKEADNTYLYLYTAIKIAAIRLAIGELVETFSLLEQLSPFIGHLHQIETTEKGLLIWEERCTFDDLNHKERIAVFSRLYYVMGVLLARQGQYTQGINCFERGIGLVYGTEEAAVKAMFTPLALEKVTAMVERGDVLAAEKELHLIKIDQNKQITSGNYTAWLELNARIQFLKGNFGESLQSLSQVITFCLDHQIIRAYVTAMINLVKVKIYLNQLSEANKLLDNVEKIAKVHKYESVKGRISRLRHLVFKRGEIPLSSFNLSPSAPEEDSNNHLDEDDKMYSEIIDLPQPSNFLNFFEDKALAFQILLSDRKFSKARLFLDNIQQEFADTDSLLIRRRIGVLEFLMNYYQEKLDKSQLCFGEILNFFKKESLKPELWQFQRILSWTELLPMEEREELIKKNDQLLEEITQSLPPENQAVFLRNKWTADEEYLDAAINELLYLKLKGNRFKPFRIFNLIKMIRRLNKLLHHIDRYKDVLARKTINNKTEEEKTDKAASLLYRILRHPRDRITISFLVLPDRLLIVYTTFLKLNFKLSVVNRILLRDLIKELHQSVVFSTGGRHVASIKKKGKGQEVLKIAEEIAVILQIPEILSEIPKSVKKITFVPDDNLNGFPFAALRYQGEYIIKKYSMAIGYESKVPRKEKKATNKNGLLMVAISKGKGNLPALPGAKAEVKELKKLFYDKIQNIKVLHNERASKKAILSQLDRSRLFHIACHGEFQRNRPDATGLLLMNGEVLSLRDILNDDVFDGLEHVTLSSCWAADHFILPGRWVISLPETLWRSGVNSILGCLWQVKDAFAVSFMREFYQNIRSNPRDVALKKTQIAAIENRLPGCNGKTENPFYWSGFNLYGEYEKIIF